MRNALTVLAVLVILAVVVTSIGFLTSQKTDVDEIKISLLRSAGETTIRIAHVSDLHYPNGFLSLEELIRLLSEQKPDLIVFTGDIADGNASDADVERLSDLFSACSLLCPSFLVIGNHEIGSDYLDLYLDIAKNSGVMPLPNEIRTVTVNGKQLAVIGLSDGYAYEEKTFSSIPTVVSLPKILLSHRPEGLKTYASAPESIRPDLIFAGHAHGGIARAGNLALYAPNQGLFPRYTSGLYTQDGSQMIVSRGLGNSGTDFRCFNPYHLPVVTLTV